MEKNLHDYRKSYDKGTLDKKDVSENPLDQFKLWFNDAEISKTVDEINAMTICTVDASGMPRGRVVLLKEITAEGFIFYTNYTSKKGEAITKNPNVSISFFWPGQERQIIIQGIASKISEEKSLDYFLKRPRESQLGALVSDQSKEIKDRSSLEERKANLENKYKGQEFPKPKNWGGYIIKPQFFEFWQGRKSRLHDRMFYEKVNTSWVLTRLQP